jgi:hypothetical protein
MNICCRKCKIEKSTENFTKLNNQVINFCLDCNKKQSLEYYNQNKIVRNEINKHFGKERVVCPDCKTEYMKRCKYRHLKSKSHIQVQ